MVGVDHIVGGQRAAVMKCDALAQMKRPRQLIGTDAPRLGERGSHLEVLVGLDECVEDVLEHLERKVRACLVRVELIGFAGDRRHEIARGLVAEVDTLARCTGAKSERDDRAHHCHARSCCDHGESAIGARPTLF